MYFSMFPEMFLKLQHAQGSANGFNYVFCHAFIDAHKKLAKFEHFHHWGHHCLEELSLTVWALRRHKAVGGKESFVYLINK